jgi:glycosyltransferase involved in cell wall biosynthesis
MTPTPDTVLYGVTIGTTASKLLRGQLASLAARGWIVHLACSPGPELDASVAREGCEGHPIRMEREISPLRDLRALAAWFTLVRKVRPAVTHLSTPKAALLGTLAAWILRVPRRVYLVRGLRLEGTHGASRPLLWLSERITIGLSTDVVVVSPSLGTQMARHRLLGRHHPVLIGNGSSNGVDVAAIADRVATAGRAQMRTRLQVDGAAVVVGYVGRIVADKGIETLLAALDRCRSRFTLLLVGSVDHPGLAQAIASSAVPVVHVEWTDDVWSYYAAMDLLCLPTRREGFPNVVLEAAAAGIPSVSTDATGAVDAVIPTVTGETVAVGDAPALAAAIDRLVDDAAERARLGAAAKERAARDFRPQDIWAGMDAILRGQDHPNIRMLTN